MVVGSTTSSTFYGLTMCTLQPFGLSNNWSTISPLGSSLILVINTINHIFLLVDVKHDLVQWILWCYTVVPLWCSTCIFAAIESLTIFILDTFRFIRGLWMPINSLLMKRMPLIAAASRVSNFPWHFICHLYL